MESGLNAGRIRSKTNKQAGISAGRGRTAWADNHANQRHPDATRLSPIPATSFLARRVATLNARTSTRACTVALTRMRPALDPTSRMIFPAAAPIKTFDIDWGYNDVLVTIGYCGEPQPWVTPRARVDR